MSPFENKIKEKNIESTRAAEAKGCLCSGAHPFLESLSLTDITSAHIYDN